MPESGIVVRRTCQIVVADIGPLRLWQIVDVTVDRRIHRGVIRQRPRCGKNILGRVLGRIRGEVVPVRFTGTERAVQRRDDAIRRLVCCETLELIRYLRQVLVEDSCAGFRFEFPGRHNRSCPTDSPHDSVSGNRTYPHGSCCHDSRCCPR